MAASVSSDSPHRRFMTKNLANKENSPVELNRLKSLLMKKVGEDGNVASPKKAGTPRKEVKVKRGATVKLCSSCEQHNKDVSADPPVDDQKQTTSGNGEAAKKKRATKKDTDVNSQGQNSNTADATKTTTVEKKAVVKKPRETKKKAVTPDERLDIPSTSGTVPSETEGSVLNDGGILGEGESKLKRHRKKVEKTVQQDESEALVSKGKGSKSKGKDIVKVKVSQPRKKKLPEDSEIVPLENMDVTDNVNSIHLGEDVQSAAKNSGTKSKSKKTSKVPAINSDNNVIPDSKLANVDEPSDNSVGSSVVKEAAPKSKAKTKDASKAKVSRSKKIAKNLPEDNEKTPFDNMDVTDLVHSIQEGQGVHSAADKSGGSTKDQSEKTNRVHKVYFETDVTPDSILDNVDEPSDNQAGSSVVKEAALKSKAKTKDANKAKVSRSKKIAKNLPEDNEKTPFDNMDVTDLVNSIQQGGVNTVKNSNSTLEPRKTAKARKNNIVKNVTPDSTLNVNETSNNSIQSPNNNACDREVVDNSEDMFKDDSVTTIEKRTEAMNFSGSNKTAPKNKSNSTISKSTKSKENEAHSENLSSNMYFTQGDISHDPIYTATILTPATELNLFNEVLSDFNFADVMPPPEIIGTSKADMINLSTSTNISHDEITEGNSMDLSREVQTQHSKDDTFSGSTSSVNKNLSHHSNIHDDETFFNENVANISVDNMQIDANITLRNRIVRRNKTNASKNMDCQENISSSGISSFTQKDSNDDVTQQILNQNDEIQQPSTTDFENLLQIKLEATDDIHATSSRSFTNHNSSTVSSGSNETNVLMNKSQKQASKSAELKSKTAKKLEPPVKTSEVSEPPEKSKMSKKDSAIESSQKSASNPVNSTLQKKSGSSKKNLKSRKNDDTLCEKHKYSKERDEKAAHRLAKEKKSNKQLRNDMKVAKAMEAMSKHFSRISIGTTIGTINELHIGKLSSESDSSMECSTDCSCDDYTSYSNSSGDHCKCWQCLMQQSDSSDSSASSSSDDESDDESSSSDSSSSATSSSLDSPVEAHRPMKKCASKEMKSAKPAYKEKLNKFCSKYDLRSNICKYDLRSRDYKT